MIAGVLSLAQRLSSADTMEGQLTYLCRTTAERLGCDRSSIFLREGNLYRARFNHGNPSDIAAVFPKHRVRLDDPLIARAVATRSFVMINDARQSPLMNQRTARAARIHSIVVAPLFGADDDPRGFLTAEFNERPAAFSETSSALVLGFAKLAELTARAHQRDAARRQAEEELGQSRAQLEALSDRLQLVKDEESARIAREIHDELGQALTTLKFDVEWLRKRLQQDAPLRRLRAEARCNGGASPGLCRRHPSHRERPAAARARRLRPARSHRVASRGVLCPHRHCLARQC